MNKQNLYLKITHIIIKGPGLSFIELISNVQHVENPSCNDNHLDQLHWNTHIMCAVKIKNNNTKVLLIK